MNNLLKKYAAGRFDIYNSITYSFSRLSLNKVIQSIRIMVTYSQCPGIYILNYISSWIQFLLTKINMLRK